jgi:hypothetical protein
MFNVKWFIVLTTAMVLTNSYILYYIMRLERIECACALTRSQKFIKYYLYGSITANTIVILSLLSKRLSKRHALYRNYMMIFIPATIIYTYITYHYVKFLREKGCNCSHAIQRYIMYAVSLIMSIVYSIGGIWIFFGVVFVAFFMKK